MKKVVEFIFTYIAVLYILLKGGVYAAFVFAIFATGWVMKYLK